MIKFEFDNVSDMEDELGKLGFMRTQQMSLAPESEVSMGTVTPDPVPEPTVDPNELDSARRPWDARINTVKRTKVKDGTWKRKRGVSDELYNQVVSELDAIEPESVPETPVETNDPEPSTDTSVDTPVTADTIRTKLQELLANGKISATDMMSMLQEQGVPNMMELPNHPESFTVLHEKLENM